MCCCVDGLWNKYYVHVLIWKSVAPGELEANRGHVNAVWSMFTREAHFHITTSFGTAPQKSILILLRYYYLLKYTIQSIVILWIFSTMSDATLPPPPRSSSAPVSEGRQRSDSSSGEGEFDTSLDQSIGNAAREDDTGDSGGRTDNKQKRKRTRYDVEFSFPFAPRHLNYGLSNLRIHGQLEFSNAFGGHC